MWVALAAIFSGIVAAVAAIVAMLLTEGFAERRRRYDRNRADRIEALSPIRSLIDESTTWLANVAVIGVMNAETLRIQFAEITRLQLRSIIAAGEIEDPEGSFNGMVKLVGDVTAEAIKAGSEFRPPDDVITRGVNYLQGIEKIYQQARKAAGETSPEREDEVDELSDE